jgi:hypothetical protein
MRIETREDFGAFAARVIIADEWEGILGKAKKLLQGVCEKFPSGRRVKFLLTCGGFIQFDWPKHVSASIIGSNLDPNPEAVNALVKEAEKAVRYLLNGGLDEKLREVTDYVTFGVDSENKDGSIELVSLVDLKTNRFYWTGKSYPTTDQERELVRIADLRTHFVELEGVGKVMVLGCHDLNIFSPRSRNAKGWRRKVNGNFRELAKKERPVCVLHHPHYTVKVRTWCSAWISLRKSLPFVKWYFGAGRYYKENRPREEYDLLEEVLRCTKLGDSMDFICSLS